MEYVIFTIVIVLLFLVLFISGSISDTKRKKKIIEEMREEYGKIPYSKYYSSEQKNIKEIFERRKTNDSIDDITAGDLELDDIFKRINYCRSSMGTSVLYNILRNPDLSLEKTSSLESKINYFTENSEDRYKLRTEFNDIGRIRVSLFECLDIIESLPTRNLLVDYLAAIFIIVGFGSLFINPYVGILILIAVLCFNIISYYSARGGIEPFIIAFGYINKFIRIAKPFSSLKIDCIQEEIDIIEKNVKVLKGFTKHAGLVINNNSSKIGSGNPLEIVLDYMKMLLHVDIIYFYKMLSELIKNRKCVEELYYSLGEIESYISIAYYRASLSDFCIPEKREDLSITNAYHPLINNPVKNSITCKSGVLITGSNASGKSTFLKTVAVNILLAETIHTCTADSYSGQGYALFSSMSLRDNLSGNDSYFMVEIKAMKRILDYKNSHPETAVICFVDEVLRGTNTLERIASSTEILKYLLSSGTITFAATHDGELTYLLEDLYDNYHFEEEIKNNDVIFNYRLIEGRAGTRNAIKLLSVMGFPKDIIDNAEKRANNFLQTGEWK